LPLATAVSLNYTSPLLLAVMLAFVLRERPGRIQLIALAGGPVRRFAVVASDL
jgi:drug/metabolite transporter (DMT)-like permease